MATEEGEPPAIEDQTAATESTKVRALYRMLKGLLSLSAPRPDGWLHVVSPTLDDCADFVESIRNDPALTAAPEGAGPLVCCRAFYAAKLAPVADPAELSRLCVAVMRGLHVLHFPIAGAVQVQSVYENAAKKAAAEAAHFLWLCRSHVKDEMDENEEEGFDDPLAAIPAVTLLERCRWRRY